MPVLPAPLRRTVSLCLAVLLVIHTSGCASWRPAPDTTPAALAEGNPVRFRLTFRDGSVIERRTMQVARDSVFVPGDERSDRIDSATRQVYALADITLVEKRNRSNAAPLLVGGLVFVLVIGLAAAAAGGGGSGGTISIGSGSGSLSCPLVYSWDGSGYRLDSGTFGGAVMPALARTDLDNLEFIRPVGDELRFLMTAEQPETEYVDAFDLLAVDHPAGTAMIPDGRANGHYLAVGTMQAPLSARGLDDREMTAALSAVDDTEWTTRLAPRSAEERRDGVVATFARPVGDTATLVVDGRNTEWSAFLVSTLVHATGRGTASWYHPESGPAAARRMHALQERHGALAVSVWSGGGWRPAGTIWEAGPEVTKRQALPLDLRGIVGPVVTVRLESTAAFWAIDRVALAASASKPLQERVLAVHEAIDDAGADRSDALAAVDREHVVMERGDTVRIVVKDPAPAPAAATRRSYLLRTSGWYRVHGRDAAEPEHALLARLASPDGPALVATEWFNGAVRALAQGVRADD